MRIITKSFFESSSIEKTEGTVAVMDFLASPSSVNKMILATEQHIPALAGVVEELEELFGDSDTFPLNHEGEDKHAPNRRNVGWMVRFIMREYGYSPVANSERTRIGSNSGSKFFRNAAVYEKTDDNPNYVILSSTMVTSRSWSPKDMMIGRDDPLYKDTKEKMKKAAKRLKDLKMSKDFFLTYLMRTGFNNCISLANMVMILMGLQVPCPELCEAIENALLLFESFDYIDSTRVQNRVIEDAESNYILRCCLEADQYGLGTTLKRIFDDNASGLYWKAKRNDFFELIDYAKRNYAKIPKKTVLSEKTEEYYYLKSNFKLIKERIEEMSASCVELDQRQDFVDYANTANKLYSQISENPKDLNITELYELILNCWSGLNDWTITYCFLGSLVAVEKNWKLNEDTLHELWSIAEKMMLKEEGLNGN